MMKCPCNRCLLTKSLSRDDIKGDLMCHGFLSSYTSWILHGEEVSVTGNARLPSDVDEIELDSTLNILDDHFPDINMNMPGETTQPMGTDTPSTSSGTFGKGESFDELFADYNQELYPGYSKFTKLSFILKLYDIKCMCKISDKGMSMVLDLMKEAFTHAKLPDSFNDMKKVIRQSMRVQMIACCIGRQMQKEKFARFVKLFVGKKIQRSQILNQRGKKVKLLQKFCAIFL